MSSYAKRPVILLAVAAITTSCTSSARPGAAPPRPDRLALVRDATVVSIGDSADDWGKTLDGRGLGDTVDLSVIIRTGTNDEVAFVVAGAASALRIPIAPAPDHLVLHGPDGLMFVSQPEPHPYAERRDAFADAPPLPTRSPVLASYAAFRGYDIAWVVTREGDALVVWVATGPYEDVTTEGATWDRLVNITLRPGASIEAPT